MSLEDINEQIKDLQSRTIPALKESLKDMSCTTADRARQVYARALKFFGMSDKETRALITKECKRYIPITKETLKAQQNRLKELLDYRSKRVMIDKGVKPGGKVKNKRHGGGHLQASGGRGPRYQSAPAFDSFPKESQVKQHPLYGNLRY